MDYTFTPDELLAVLRAAYLDGNTDGYFGVNERTIYTNSDLMAFFDRHPQLPKGK